MPAYEAGGEASSRLRPTNRLSAAQIQAARRLVEETRRARSGSTARPRGAGGGLATLMADIAAAAQTAGSLSREVTPTYGQLLARLIDPERFPALYETVASGALDDEDDPDAEFNFGLARTLDGIDALVRARA